MTSDFTVKGNLSVQNRAQDGNAKLTLQDSIGTGELRINYDTTYGSLGVQTNSLGLGMSGLVLSSAEYPETPQLLVNGQPIGGGSMTLLASQTFDIGNPQSTCSLTITSGYKDLSIRIFNLGWWDTAYEIFSPGSFDLWFLDGYGYNTTISTITNKADVGASSNTVTTSTKSTSTWTISEPDLMNSSNNYIEIKISDYDTTGVYWRGFNMNANFNTDLFVPTNLTASGYITGDPGLTNFIMQTFSASGFGSGTVEIYGVN